MPDRSTHLLPHTVGVVWDPVIVPWPAPERGYRVYFLVDGLGGKPGDAFWLRSWIATAYSEDLLHWTNATLIRFPEWHWHRNQDLRFLAPLAVPHQPASSEPAKGSKGGGIRLFFSTAMASSRCELPILAMDSPDGVHFTRALEAAQGLSPESAEGHYEGGAGQGVDDGAMRAWGDPELLRGVDGVPLGDGIEGYRYMYFSAQVPKRGAMMATLTMCGQQGDDCEHGWFRGTIAVARQPAHSGKGVGRSEGGWEILGPAAYLSVKTYIERDPMSIVATNQTAFWEMERPQVMVGPGGKYHMFFHCWHAMVNPEWANQAFNTTTWPHPHGHDSTWYHLVAARPEGPFHPPASGEPPVVRGSWVASIYGSHIFPIAEAQRQGRSALGVAGWYITRNTLEISGRFRLQWDRQGAPELCDMQAQDQTQRRKRHALARELRRKRGPRGGSLPPPEAIAYNSHGHRAGITERKTKAGGGL